MKLLFIINNRSGNNSEDYINLIQTHFHSSPHRLYFYEIPANCTPQQIKSEIDEFRPDRVMVIGGDGTAKVVAESLIHSSTPFCIIPAGSANGMAKELDMPLNFEDALDTGVTGKILEIHAVKVNDEICLHLCDIGFNAFVVKEFEKLEHRGMWGYIKAAWKVLWLHDKMKVELQLENETILRTASMIVIANATKYGTGAVINPGGKLDDDLFEVIVVRKISITELFKMRVTHRPYDPRKTEVFQTRSLYISSKKKVHFQVDGEYLGKLKEIKADIILNALKVIVPDSEN